MTDAELQYFYSGFYRALKRYRSTSLLGWTIVLLGCLVVLLRWNLERTFGPLDTALAALTVFAGLAVVWQNISALEQYLRVPFPVATEDPVLAEIKSLMHEVDEGGWQEAYAAIGQLTAMQRKYGLPELH
jgi:hypothetical protein